MIPSEGPASAEDTVLTRQTWPTVGAPVLVLPLGSTEQHGPHLPVDTDTAIAEAVAHQLAHRLHSEGVRALVAPPLAYGASGEHAGFPGTVSLGHEALNSVLLEYGRSALIWAERLLIVNGHGGNTASLSKAVPQLVFEARDVAWIPCANGAGLPGPDDDTHAGRIETSLMLHIAPDRVRMDKAEPGVTEPLGSILPKLMTDGVKGVTTNGVLGDPTGADAQQGQQLLQDVVETAYQRYSAWDRAENGCLRFPSMD